MAGSGGSAGGATLPENEFARGMASAICDNAGECCVSAGFAHDLAACRASAEAYFNQVVAAYATRAVRYNASAAAGCAEGYATWLRACDETLGDDWRESCYATWEGVRMLGETCEEGFECEGENLGRTTCFVEDSAMPDGPTICIQPSSAHPDTAVHGALGDPCFATCKIGVGDAYCRDVVATPAAGAKACFSHEGLECKVESATCEPLSVSGEPCFDLCAPGAYCAGGYCAEKHANGETCYDQGASCVSGVCLDRMCGYAPVATATLCAGDPRDS